jgi:cellulose biosynthesis protein BcsQ
MAIFLSLLSGKGGCGKTTIALSLAKMLNDCGVSVLVIDCDTATNGATYFFETKLINKEHTISLGDIVNNQIGYKAPLHVEEKFDFIPSNLYFANDRKKETDDFGDLLQDNLRVFTNNYEVVIFDCQAGYSNILSIILKLTTINLVVMEPDAISSSAIRVLYAQVSDLLERSHTYQIFNKITDEEYAVYEKVTSGTLFDAVPPIKFNWQVRKAFAFAQVPEMATTNTEFGNDVFQLAKILFPTLVNRLFVYSKKILLMEQETLVMSLRDLESKNYLSKRKKKTENVSRLLSYIISIISFIAVAISLLPIWKNTKYKFSYDEGYIWVTVLMALTLSTVLITAIRLFVKKKEENLEFMFEKKQKTAKYEYEMNKLEQRLDEINQIITKQENQKVSNN